MRNDELSSDISGYYQANNPAEKILERLRTMYGARELLSVAELAFVDSFHIRGRAATISLAKEAGIREDMKILDIGSGPGGTARYLGASFGVDVVGLDLTYEFTQLASTLSKKASLSDRNSFLCGSATDIPFGDNCFDRVWMEHVQMNIRDKATLVEEIYRVLKPGGELALYEVFHAGESSPEYPLPWAENTVASLLISPVKMRELLEDQGFIISHWHDCYNEIVSWHEKVSGKRKIPGAESPGVHLLMGERATEKVHNLTTGVLNQELAIIEAVVRK